ALPICLTDSIYKPLAFIINPFTTEEYLIMYKKLSILLGFGVLSSVSMLASAQNLYMNDLKLKADLDWLNTQGVAQISTSTWPLTANEIKRALNTANVQTPAQQQIMQSVQARLAQNRDSVVKGSATLHIQTDRDQLPQKFA